jgi:hypothetical protein
MLANNQSHVNAIEFPLAIGFFNQDILSPIYSLVLFFLSYPLVVSFGLFSLYLYRSREGFFFVVT